MRNPTPLALGTLALVLIGGLWLAISPFLLGTQPAGAFWLPSTFNAVIVGAVLVLAATVGILLRVLLGVRDLVRVAEPTVVGRRAAPSAAHGGPYTVYDRDLGLYVRRDARGAASSGAYPPTAAAAPGPRQPPTTLPPRGQPPAPQAPPQAPYAPYPSDGWEPYQPHGEEGDGHTHDSARPALPQRAGSFPIAASE